MIQELEINEDVDLQKQNKKLTRKVKLLEQSLEQFSNIKKKYDELIVKLNEKDQKLQEVNENLETKVFERTLELQNYIDAINNVAIVIEFDDNFNITDVNDTFVNRIGYSKTELLELNLTDILEGSRASIFLKELKDALNHNETVKYNNKFISKDKGYEFFVKNSYFTIELEENKKKHMAIGFSVTNETLEKKEFNKKVIEKIREVNQHDLENRKTISKLTQRIEQYDNYLRSMQKDIEVYKNKLIIKSRQIISFEEQLSTVDKKYQNIMVSKNKEIETFNKSIRILKDENEKLHNENEDLKHTIKNLQKELEK